MAQCDIQQCLCHIATFIKVDVILRHSSKWVSYCDIQGNCGIMTYIKVVDSDIEELCDIGMLIKVELLYNMYIALINGDDVF